MPVHRLDDLAAGMLAFGERGLRAPRVGGREEPSAIGVVPMAPTTPPQSPYRPDTGPHCGPPLPAGAIGGQSGPHTACHWAATGPVNLPLSKRHRPAGPRASTAKRPPATGRPYWPGRAEARYYPRGRNGEQFTAIVPPLITAPSPNGRFGSKQAPVLPPTAPAGATVSIAS